MRSCIAIAKQLEERTLCATPLITSHPTTHLFLQVHSANCNCFCGDAEGEVGGDSEVAKQLEEHFRRQPRISPRTPPCTFFCNCILQAAIDFAEVRMQGGVGGVACFAPTPNFEQTFGFKNGKAFIYPYA